MIRAKNGFYVIIVSYQFAFINAYKFEIEPSSKTLQTPFSIVLIATAYIKTKHSKGSSENKFLPSNRFL